jgi:thiamine biosynthesis protein ThiS
MRADEVSIRANGQDKRIKLPCSLLEFLASCGWKPAQVVVEYNGSVIPRGQLADVQLKSGDQLEIIIPVAGG